VELVKYFPKIKSGGRIQIRSNYLESRLISRKQAMHGSMQPVASISERIVRRMLGNLTARLLLIVRLKAGPIGRRYRDPISSAARHGFNHETVEHHSPLHGSEVKLTLDGDGATTAAGGATCRNLQEGAGP
jgi:hypothetical protein